ncbi:MAG: Gfo/Idh/MocA family oxidoreductase, partial [Clostridia bacterium]|nr:Gfo/Idh/MocA family oxidoreductase [Clostridia bacterium]
MYRIGIIGCGNRMSGVYPHLIKNHGDMRIAAVADPRTDDMRAKFDGQDVHIYADAERMLASESLDAVMIGTRCSLHTPMALIAGKAGLPMFLEKPVSISWEQLSALESLMPMSDKIVVSFPLRRSAIVERVKEIIDGGTLGTIQHVQAWNNV